MSVPSAASGRVSAIEKNPPAIITEGALKGTTIAHYMDRGVITVQGVSSFKEDFGKRIRAQIPELPMKLAGVMAHNKCIHRQLR